MDCQPSGLLPPPWVASLLGGAARLHTGVVQGGGELSLDITYGEGFCLLSVRAEGVRGLGRTDFQAVTTRAYRCIAAELPEGYQPVRLWNHIPGIHDDLRDPGGEGLDRYMVFNAGRFEALAEWLGRESFDTRIASASGVGHGGQDLVLHCLAADQPGRAVANPRQTAPYRYSQKYGPHPPCFARATVIEPPAGARGAPPLVLVGGTASIVGEESLHPGDLARQTDETLTNLAVLLRAAAGAPAPAAGERAAILAGFRELRVYVPDPGWGEPLCGLLQDAVPASHPSSGSTPISAGGSFWWRSKDWRS